MIIEPFVTFQLMFLILDALNDEKPNEKVIVYLADANPFMREGENSVDVVVYQEFKDEYLKYFDHSNYSYNFIKYYLKNIDYYENIYELFCTISQEEYVDTCKNILEYKLDILK